MGSIEKLVDEARNLPHDQKLTLANRVLELTETTIADEVEDEWDSELRAGIQAYDAGHSQTRPAGEVLKDRDSKLSSRRSSSLRMRNTNSLKHRFGMNRRSLVWGSDSELRFSA
jgi:hypothetical protein